MRPLASCVLFVLAARGASADTLADAQHLFYNGRYAEAASLSRRLDADESILAVYELRTSALLFQLRRAIGDPKDKEKAFKACEPCPALLDAFMKEFAAGRNEARDILEEAPDDLAATFFLGKLDLNYVWLVLGTLGKRTGWNEYWEARHALDKVLAVDAQHLRARTARAWIDYIVDTKAPWGTRWLLGGGNRKKALRVMHEAVDVQADRFDNAEALFGLWDMQVREKNYPAALDAARRLAELFPENADVLKFIETHGNADAR